MKINQFLQVTAGLLLAILCIGTVHAYNQTNFTSNTTYTVPSGVYYLFVETWGAGGGGGYASGALAGAGGGGAGGYGAQYIPVTAGQNFTVIVGAGGLGGDPATAATGKPGQTSQFNNSVYSISATGGTAGQEISAPGTALGGIGGYSTAIIARYGGNGSTGVSGSSGGGGGGAGNETNGGNATTTTGGTGGTLLGGTGGTGRSSDGKGGNGSIIGGGGAGGYCDGTCTTVGAGGNGSRGQVRITTITDNTTLILVNVYDETTLQKITSETINLTISPVSGNGSDQNYSITTGSLFLLNQTEATQLFKFVGSTYTLRNYLVTPTNGSMVTLNAYLSTSTGNTIFQVRDSQSGAQLENAIISMARSLNGTFTTVDSQYTDITGTGSFQYVPLARYRFTITLTGYTTLIFYLDPVLLSAYQITLTSDSGANINNTQDYAGLGVVFAPKIFYNLVQNNATFSVASPNGTLSFYNVTVTYPNGSTYASTTKNGINAYGETLQLNFTINNPSIYNTLNVTYTIIASNTGSRTYNFTYSIQDTTSAGLFTYNQDHTYGMGAFERIIITTIVVLLVAGTIAPFLGAQAAGLMGLFVLSYMTVIGFNPWWAAVVSIFAGFALLSWVSGRQ